MGVDSGLPDFRGKEGFWKAYPKAKELNLDFSQMANPYWFAVNPFMAWAFYGHRYNLYKNTVPHDGFKMLFDLVKSKNDDYFIYTSNVDGQFQKAGFDENKIVECHGSIHHFQCSENCKSEIWESPYDEIEIDMEKFESIDIPLCPNCNDISRPNILMFSDFRWNSKRTENQEGRFNRWIKKFRYMENKLVIIEIGAGIAIPTITVLGNSYAKRYKDNIKLIRINPIDFEVDREIGFSIPLGGLEGIKLVIV
ncbi:SIR2 family NAD-dependent protein deacylase [Aliarcobacter butzleri]|uniref:SIR2 family NAD-dependent protein deacylase n=1 Tax=Aliarcobacter butzleri TaxID=28197 RepID=UPI0012F7D1F4|nr:Sir2 family NAD-dependent protein deacetylase [Aliarcobacter butzleri]